MNTVLYILRIMDLSEFTFLRFLRFSPKPAQELAIVLTSTVQNFEVRVKCRGPPKPAVTRHGT